MITMHRMTSANMLGHLFFHKGVLPSLDPLSVRRSDEVAGVCSVSSSLSLLSSLASSGVSSVVRLDGMERRDRDDRPDFCEAGRELGVLVEANGPSGVSMAAGLKDEGER